MPSLQSFVRIELDYNSTYNNAKYGLTVRPLKINKCRLFPHRETAPISVENLEISLRGALKHRVKGGKRWHEQDTSRGFLVIHRRYYCFGSSSEIKERKP